MTTNRDLLLHPIRLRIVQALVANPMTPRRLRAQLGDVPQASLYRHLGHLADAGLITVVDERPVRGVVERTYGVVESAVSLGADDVADATADEHVGYFTTFLGTLLSQFGAYIADGEVDVAADGIGYRQAALWLSDDEFDTLIADLTEVVQGHLQNQPTPDRRRRLLSTIVMPDAHA